MIQTQVGDRHVIDQLLERDWRLGGEQSGHIVWTDLTPTGDGIAASLWCCGPSVSAASRTSSRSSACRSAWKRPHRRSLEVEGATEVWDAVERGDVKLNGRGRVLSARRGRNPSSA